VKFEQNTIFFDPQLKTFVGIRFLAVTSIMSRNYIYQSSNPLCKSDLRSEVFDLKSTIEICYNMKLREKSTAMNPNPHLCWLFYIIIEHNNIVFSILF
jgi:hypothetical protein